jgi:Zn-dependent protease
MIKPEVVAPGEDVDVVGYIFDAPLVTKGRTWLPLTQLVTWLVMAREAGRLHPERNWFQRLGVASMTMPVILGSEWCHNLAHAAAAKGVGHPVDAIRITWGMPLLIYYDTEDPDVTPRQHIIRAIGGPVINTIFWGIAVILRRFSSFGNPSRDVADAAVGMNLLLTIAGMTPQPYLDGGVALKWALVEKGRTLADSDQTVQKANGVAAAGMGIGAAVAFKKRKKFLGALMALMAALSVGVAAGLLKEKTVNAQ